MCKVSSKVTKYRDHPDRDRGGGEHVFQHQVPADEPGDELAQGRVAVGVGAARDRHHGGEFGVAQAGEYAAQAGDDEGQDHGRSGVFGGGDTGQHKDAGADDAADAQRGEGDRPEGTVERGYCA